MIFVRRTQRGRDWREGKQRPGYKETSDQQKNPSLVSPYIIMMQGASGTGLYS
jgi:hypothetical protein